MVKKSNLGASKFWANLFQISTLMKILWSSLTFNLHIFSFPHDLYSQVYLNSNSFLGIWDVCCKLCWDGESPIQTGLIHVWWSSRSLGPSINDVGNFYGLLTTPSPCRQILVLSVGNFDQFLTLIPLPIADVVYGWPLCVCS